MDLSVFDTKVTVDSYVLTSNPIFTYYGYLDSPELSIQVGNLSSKVFRFNGISYNIFAIGAGFIESIEDENAILSCNPQFSYSACIERKDNGKYVFITDEALASQFAGYDILFSSEDVGKNIDLSITFGLPTITLILELVSNVRSNLNLDIPVDIDLGSTTTHYIGAFPLSKKIVLSSAFGYITMKEKYGKASIVETKQYEQWEVTPISGDVVEDLSGSIPICYLQLEISN